jgi:hypothetical protein
MVKKVKAADVQNAFLVSSFYATVLLRNTFTITKSKIIEVFEGK